MKKILAVAMLSLVSASAFAKTLTVECSSEKGSVSLVSQIKNINKPQKITSLVVNDEEISGARDASTLPLMTDDKITLFIQYGDRLYSSVKIEASDCDDEFKATGTATISEYVGGFAGTSKTVIKSCECSLK